jgi:hypothetical protein
MAGSIIQKPRDSLWILPREGVSSNLMRPSENGRLLLNLEETEREHGHHLHRRPVAAMADAMSSPVNLGSPVPDHQTTRKQLQSVEKINPSSSTRFMPSTMSRRESAARGGTAAPLSTDGELQKLTSKPLQPKGKHKKIEETSADSPTRRIWPQIHPKAP